MSPSEPQSSVARRRVLYIPGYDPMPARAYRERYRREAARQAVVSGHEIAVAAAQGNGWHVAARIEGAEVAARVEVLPWADIVRGSMAQGVAATYAQLWRTAWVYVSTGALFRLMRLRKGPVIAALYPVAVLLGQLVIAAALGGVGALVVGAVVDRVAGSVGGLDGSASVIRALSAGVVAALVAWSVLRGFRRRDRLLAWYIMHDFAFAARDRGAYPPALEVRIGEFARRIAEALEEPVEEVLVVGHSSGAYLAVSALADLVRSGPAREGGPVLSLLTLGQVVPMVSFLPRAGRLRADLALMSETGRVAWVDVTAPGDACSFALCDPVAVSGVAGPGKRWPLVLSAAFGKTLSAGRAGGAEVAVLRAAFPVSQCLRRIAGGGGRL
jgi:hypothetical protein